MKQVINKHAANEWRQKRGQALPHSLHCVNVLFINKQRLGMGLTVQTLERVCVCVCATDLW